MDNLRTTEAQEDGRVPVEPGASAKEARMRVLVIGDDRDDYQLVPSPEAAARGGRGVAGRATNGDARDGFLRTADPRAGSTPPLREGRRILVAEDDPSFARALAKTFRSLGHEVEGVADGEEAWRAIGRSGFQIVFADWDMPGIDGLELCRRVRGRRGQPYVYITLLTGRDGVDDRLEGLQAGADDYLVKPVDGRDLAARLEIARRILDMQEGLLARSSEAERMHAELSKQNERLAELVSRDQLTGLYNRRHLLRALDAETALCRRTGKPLSLLMLDVDGFKRFNDDFGHGAGDEVLRRVADAFRDSFRATDTSARYGGEEFVALLPGADASAAAESAERLRACIEGRGWPFRPVTASLGVSTLAADPWDGPRLLDEADRALYRSKRGGRNRVTHHDEEDSPAGLPAARA